MSKLDELIKQYCPDGVEYKRLDSIVRIRNGRDYKAFPAGDIPVYGSGGIMTYINTYAYDKPSVLIPRKGSLGNILYVDNPFWTVDTMFYTEIDSSQIKPRYLYHILLNEHLEEMNQAGGVPSLTQSQLNSFGIPVPPILVQEEIVRILDSFTKLTAELTAELTARRAQYEYYRDKLLTFDDETAIVKRIKDMLDQTCGGPEKVEYKRLGDIGRVRMCKRILKEQTTSTGVPFYKIGTFGKEADAFIPESLFNEYRATYPYPNKGDVLISAAGTIGRAVIFDGEPSYFQDSNIVWLEHDESQVLNKFLFYFYQTAPWKASEGGTISRLYNENIEKTVIPVPPISVQQEIVSVLDKFNTLTTDISTGLPAEISLRQKQYEHYRDRLLNFNGGGYTMNEEMNFIHVTSLGGVAEVGTGSSNTNEGLANGMYPFFVRSQEVRYKNEYEFDETAIITSGDGVGVGKVFHYVDGKYALHQRAYRIHVTYEKILPKFLFHYMRSKFPGYIEAASFHSSVTSIRRPMLTGFPIPVLPLCEQEKIVNLLDRFEKYCGSLSEGLPAEIEARRKQYEYYRDKLLDFKEKKV